jgi:tRNA G37 N-methylase Trm5
MANEHRDLHCGIQSVGNTPAVAGIDAVALYEPRDGRIIHMHHVVVFEGARRQSHDELQRRAEEAAKGLGRKIDGLKTLHIQNFSPAPGKHYRVDAKKSVLVEEKVPDRSRA